MDIFGKFKDNSRLAAEIDFCQNRLNYLKQKQEHPSDDHWSEKAKELLDGARKALREGNIDLGWRYLDSSRCFLFLGINDRDALRAEAQAIFNEAEDSDKKISEWRKKTIIDILYIDGKLKQEVKEQDLFNASTILFENQHNRYIRVWRIKRILTILTIIALLTISILVWISPPIDHKIFVADRLFILSVVLFGVMGASISGILTVARSGPAARIPDQLIDFWVLLAKLVVGAASALVVFAFILSGILNYKAEPAQIMAISFAAGFSERLVTSAIESVTTK